MLKKIKGYQRGRLNKYAASWRLLQLERKTELQLLERRVNVIVYQQKVVKLHRHSLYTFFSWKTKSSSFLRKLRQIKEIKGLKVLKENKKYIPLWRSRVWSHMRRDRT